MTEELYAQIMAECSEAKTPEAEEAFDNKRKERVSALSPEETDIELAFLETKVHKYLAEKQARQNVEATA